MKSANQNNNLKKLGDELTAIKKENTVEVF